MTKDAEGGATANAVEPVRQEDLRRTGPSGSRMRNGRR